MVATQIFCIFTPIPGEMIQFDEHIFQMGWNHQPANHVHVHSLFNNFLGSGKVTSSRIFILP